MLFLFLAFAFFYPTLCARLGLRLDASDALEQIVAAFGPRVQGAASSLTRIAQILTLLFLLLGPLACMGASLLCVIWIFTLAQIDPKRGFAFPDRLFTLPVSTRFLASWLMTAGAATLIVVYLGWTRLVHLPQIDVFAGYSNCLAWVTLLVACQAILWALDAFPVARVLVLTVVVLGVGFLNGPSVQEYPLLERNRTVLLSALLLTACGMAYMGLGKIRRGAWQRWIWKWRLAPSTTGINAKSSKEFRSPAQAQFWFEWRRQARKLVFYICAFSGVVPLLLYVISYIFIHPGRLSGDYTFGLGLYLLAVPLFIHFCHGVAPEQEMAQFTATRPLASGEMVVAKLKAAALSVALSWGVTLPMLAVVALLGDLPAAVDHEPFLSRNLPLLRAMWPVILLGLMFLTWRFIAADLCFGLRGKAWGSWVPGLKVYGLLGLAGLLSYLTNDPRFEQKLLQFLPFVLALLVMLKLFLAQWAFRISLKKNLLTLAMVLKFLVVWTALAAAFLVPAMVVYHRESWIASLALGIILMLPLARIGFSPIALDLGRHR